MSLALFLSADDLHELTGRRRSDAQARVLEHMGIPFVPRPNGTLAVLRSVAEKVLGGDGRMAATPAEPELQP